MPLLTLILTSLLTWSFAGRPVSTRRNLTFRYCEVALSPTQLEWAPPKAGGPDLRLLEALDERAQWRHASIAYLELAEPSQWRKGPARFLLYFAHEKNLGPSPEAPSRAFRRLKDDLQDLKQILQVPLVVQHTDVIRGVAVDRSELPHENPAVATWPRPFAVLLDEMLAIVDENETKGHRRTLRGPLLLVLDKRLAPSLLPFLVEEHGFKALYVTPSKPQAPQAQSVEDNGNGAQAHGGAGDHGI